MSNVDFYEEDSNLKQIQSFQKPPRGGLVGLLHKLGISSNKAANTLLILVILINVILTICVFVFFN
jgi:hypothetical protein